jgi:orotidine-5'-phosphate decarboxylase
MKLEPASPASRIIVALDFPSAGSALDLVDRMDGRMSWVKVGLELYLAAGPAIVETLRNRELEVFLDLKLHDIPNTVAGAVRSLSSCGASLLTVHALGGPAMLAAAQDAALASGGARLLGVTVLTSMDAVQLNAVGLGLTTGEAVQRLARLVADAGLAGVVCSPWETSPLRSQLGAAPLLVVPGIRPEGAAADDQSRTANAAEAINSGASMLVIGRPITRAPDPAAAFESIAASFSV